MPTAEIWIHQNAQTQGMCALAMYQNFSESELFCQNLRAQSTYAVSI